MRKIRKGDNVVVITGKDKGKRGAVLRVLSDSYPLAGRHLSSRSTRSPIP
jgi:large subunit ribosomal protein L24